MGRIDDAAEHLPRILARTNASTPQHELAALLALQGALLAAQGKRAESLDFARRSLALVTRLHELGSPMSLETFDLLMKSYVLSEDYRSAILLYEQHIAPLDFSPTSSRWITFLRTAGWADVEGGQPKKAIPLFERALKFAGTRPFFPGWIPRMKYQLAKALVLTNGDRKRAATLAREAHDELADAPTTGPLLADIDAFRAKRHP
jgi:tetratricopeptide (TPR) repeat protein